MAPEPDLLFLDEPTNHLDLEGIIWLEKLLAGSSFASVVVSHDRYFLENVANDIAEINRVYPEGIFRVEGAYSRFLETQGGVHGGAGELSGRSGQQGAARGGVAAQREPRRAPVNRRHGSTRPGG